MRRRSQPGGRVTLATAGGTLGIAGTLALAGCMPDEIVGPAEAMEVSPGVADAAEGAVPPWQDRALAVPGRPADRELQSFEAAYWLKLDALRPPAPEEATVPGAARIIVCSRSATEAADQPLILVDGVQTDASFDDIAALEIESFEIVKGSDASAYGEAGKYGVILILTGNTDSGRNPDGGANQLR